MSVRKSLNTCRKNWLLGVCQLHIDTSVPPVAKVITNGVSDLDLRRLKTCISDKTCFLCKLKSECKLFSVGTLFLNGLRSQCSPNYANA